MFEPMPPLHQAAEKGDLERVATLLEAAPSLVDSLLRPNTPDTPLHLASWQGHVQVVELLIARGADVNARGDGGRTPLHYAAEHGHPAVAQLLLEHGADPEAPVGDDVSPLQAATIGRDPAGAEVAEVLLRHGARLDLSSALGLRKSSEARRMIQEDPEIVRKNPYSGSLLAEVVVMIEAKINHRLPPGPVTVAQQVEAADAVLAEDGDILDLLIARGAPKQGSYEALYYAVQLPTLAIARRLLDFGAERTPSYPGSEDLFPAARRSPLRDEMLDLLQNNKAAP